MGAMNHSAPPTVHVVTVTLPSDDGVDGPNDEPPRRRSGAGEPQPPRLSEILSHIATDTSRDRICVSDLLHAMPGRATAALLFLFAAPNAVPAPPGISSLLGLPMIYLASQMMLRRQPWLPKLIAARSMRRSDFAALMNRALPLLERAERMLRPRLTMLVSPAAEMAIGLLALILAAVVALPIPLGNMLPAFAVCLLALGVLERDGLWVVIGATVGVISMAIVSGVVIAGVKLLVYILSTAFA